MSGFWTFVHLFVHLHVIHTKRWFIQSSHITPTSAEMLEGIMVNTGASTSVSHSKWDINVSTQLGSDITISTDTRWGFHPQKPSTIEIIINGSDIQYDIDHNILFAFSVHNQYFAELVPAFTWDWFKQCPASNDLLIVTNVTEMINSLIPDRYHRFCKNTVDTHINDVVDYWEITGYALYAPVYARWPMIITITNDPTTNTVSYSWSKSSNDIKNGLSIKVSQYRSSFATNQGMNIYISGESPNKAFSINSVHMMYKYELDTVSPTTPTFSPTMSPSLNHPTVFYSNNATISTLTTHPTPVPTHNATTSATGKPTLVPSLHATSFITIVPTISATESDLIPTDVKITVGAPTNSPSYMVTMQITMPHVILMLMGGSCLCIISFVSSRQMCKPKETNVKLKRRKKYTESTSFSVSQMQSQTKIKHKRDRSVSGYKSEAYHISLNRAAYSDTDSNDDHVRHISHVHVRAPSSCIADILKVKNVDSEIRSKKNSSNETGFRMGLSPSGSSVDCVGIFMNTVGPDESDEAPLPPLPPPLIALV